MDKIGKKSFQVKQVIESLPNMTKSLQSVASATKKQSEVTEAQKDKGHMEYLCEEVRRESRTEVKYTVGGKDRGMTGLTTLQSSLLLVSHQYDSLYFLLGLQSAVTESPLSDLLSYTLVLCQVDSSQSHSPFSRPCVTEASLPATLSPYSSLHWVMLEFITQGAVFHHL